MTGEAVLRLTDLRVALRSGTSLVHGVSLTLGRGERAALVGESGSGKTMVALSVLRLNPPATVISGGRVELGGTDLTSAAEPELERVRGDRVAMIYQDPLSCLNPVRTIGNQLVEAIRAHRDLSFAEARAHAIGLLEEVGVPAADRRFRAYPHEFSGGMRQRVMIAMAISCEPEVLIADEPTTALDVTTQARILALLDRLAEERGMAVLFITHDLAVAAAFCTRIHVMREGRVVEAGPLREVLSVPGDDYTRQLLDAVVTLDAEPAGQPARDVPDRPVLVEAADLVRCFDGDVRAVDGVSLRIHRGETVGLVGESGSGKSTLSQLLLGLDTPTSGSVRYGGTELAGLGARELRRSRRDMQVVLQDPIGSLNRRKTVEQIVGVPLVVHERLGRAARRARVAEALDQVGLPAGLAGRYPRELSGGQCQRVNIARAIVLRPSFLVLDEAVSAVDVVIQAQILDLLAELQARLGLTYLFVSHDLAVVRYMAPRLAVMHGGRIVEMGSRERIFDAPEHEYTRSLIAAIPSLDIPAAPGRGKPAS
ncbi:ABC transporter ATP-binding protein [Amycolatopsis antarctica]|uniref:ABC transporter ATP-binding protein n=1 Tax=Amycolatopsis antarctica TaxID=1854586 RepID=A0A263D3I9_9PSEU|nr:ABC transporter ATP-binding protein [Amycolatopsis antarctica]OZM73042.1 ABC transporter ATP-binding protein [Amycolatopsis antarctica]